MALSPRINEISKGLSIVFHADFAAGVAADVVAGGRHQAGHYTVTGDAQLYKLYLLTRPNGKTEKNYICVRNDNDQHIWIADGGL